MPIRFDCDQCKNEVSVSGWDEKRDVVIYSKCPNCLANIKITKEDGVTTAIEIIAGPPPKGFTSAFGKYTADDYGRTMPTRDREPEGAEDADKGTD